MTAVEIYHELQVVQKIKETNDSYSFVFSVPDEKKDLFKYIPGQFITLFLDVHGEKINRSYSFSSCPYIDKNLKITVQRVENGLGSNFLIDHINENDIIKVSPPAGHFFKTSLLAGEPQKGLLMFAAGSGVTPVFSILRFRNYYAKDCPAILVYSNKVSDQIIFKSQLDIAEKNYPGLIVSHHISREEKAPLKKLTSTDVKIYVNKVIQTGVELENIECFLCGPDVYMKMIRETLTGCGLKEEQIHYESFTPTSDIQNTHLGEGGIAAVYIESYPDDLSINTQAKIEAEIDNDWVEANYQDSDNVLEALLNAGEAPPFSCMAGSCQACMCELVEGKIIQEDAGVLTEEDITNKRFLSCQAQPLSDYIKIKFID